MGTLAVIVNAVIDAALIAATCGAVALLLRWGLGGRR